MQTMSTTMRVTKKNPNPEMAHNPIFRFRNRELVCDGRTRLIGILNVTPDSFSDGGRYVDAKTAIDYALEMLDAGADIVDIGGESTRPDAKPLDIETETGRVLPVLTGLKSLRPEAIVSIDTRKREVARAVLDAGADIINDVSGLQYSPRMAEAVAEYNAGLIIMHMRGTPETMQEPENLQYADVIADISQFLAEATGKAVAAGVKRDSIIIDPGIGFAKTVEQNLQIVGNAGEFRRLGFPVLVGASRKSFIGKVLDEPSPDARTWGDAAVTACLAMMKIDFVRVHEIKAMRQVLTMMEQCRKHERKV